MTIEISCETCRNEAELDLECACICRDCVESNIPHKDWEAKDDGSTVY